MIMQFSKWEYKNGHKKKKKLEQPFDLVMGGGGGGQYVQ